MQRLSTSLICLTAFALACSPVGQTTDTADTLTAPTDATSGTTGDSDSATVTSTASATDSPTLPSTTEIESSTSAPTTTDETTTSGDTCEIVPGTLYASCILPEHACTEGECIITPTGSICAPGCDGCGDDACLAEVGDDGGACIDDHCVPSCDSPDDCLGGAFCSGLGFCYWPAPQEPVDPCLEPGEVFGPCKAGGECDAGLECVVGQGTWICVAPCGDEPCASDCAFALGIEDNLACGSTDHCEVGCKSDDDCHPDAVCDMSLGSCAWPKDPGDDCRMPGGLYGPCIDNECDLGLACFTAKEGELCVPMQQGYLDVSDPRIEQCAMTLGGSFHCIKELGWCAVECGGECSAGAVCDDWTGHCVWPG